ncbi:unnamed protein product, partial [Cyprideis torosa]
MQLLKEETDKNPDKILAKNWDKGGYPYKNLMSRKNYESQKYDLQVELLKLQQWIKETGGRLVIIFEGRDAAGKGGTIKRFMEHLNPRGARVVALEKPTEEEKGQWYFQRYVKHLPSKGEMVLFDRSWYNRAGVERVMGFCTDEEYQQFMHEVSGFEANLIRNGIYVLKFWFSVINKWDDYTQAKKNMFFHTDTDESPWIVVKSDCKKRARLNAMRYVLHKFPYTNKNEVNIRKVDPLLIGRPKK